MYGAVIPNEPLRFQGSVRVSSAKDLDCLLKESEMLSNTDGRDFFAREADSTVHLHIASRPGGYEVSVLDAEQHRGPASFIPNGPDLCDSAIGRYLADEHLFTAAI